MISLCNDENDIAYSMNVIDIDCCDLLIAELQRYDITRLFDAKANKDESY